MFKNFKEQKTLEYATFRILSSERKLDYYREKFRVLKNYRSGVVFPEQLIGYTGGLYIVDLNYTSEGCSVRVSRKTFSGLVSRLSPKECTPILTDEEMIDIENKYFTITGLLDGKYTNMFHDNKFFYFIGMNQASKFAQYAIDKALKKL